MANLNAPQKSVIIDGFMLTDYSVSFRDDDTIREISMPSEHWTRLIQDKKHLVKEIFEVKVEGQKTAYYDFLRVMPMDIIVNDHMEVSRPLDRLRVELKFSRFVPTFQEIVAELKEDYEFKMDDDLASFQIRYSDNITYTAIYYASSDYFWSAFILPHEYPIKASSGLYEKLRYADDMCMKLVEAYKREQKTNES